MRYMARTREQGFLLVIVSILAFVLAALGIGILELCRMEGVLVAHDIHRLNAFHLAEAGLDRALWKLKTDPTWTEGWENQPLNDGTYTVTLEPMEQPHWYRLRSTGTSGGISKTVSLEVQVRAWPAAFDYGLFWANSTGSTDPVTLRNHTVVNGSIFAYGSIVIDSGSTIADGYVYATGTVTGQGDYQVGELADDLPERVTLDTTYYDNLIAQASQQPAGNWTLNGSYFLMGQTLLVNGNVEINGGTLHGPGRIVATGDINFDNNWQVADGVDVISGAKITMDNRGLYLANGNVVFARDSMDIGNNITVTEQLTLSDSVSLITPGQLRLHNHVTVRGLLYAGEVYISNHPSITGTIYADEVYSDEVANHPVITYDSSVLDGDLPPGIPSGEEVEVRLAFGTWDEE